jgi:hypothetical protein
VLPFNVGLSVYVGIILMDLDRKSVFSILLIALIFIGPCVWVLVDVSLAVQHGGHDP